MTLYEVILSNSIKYPDSTAYRYFNQTCTFREFIIAVDNMACSLKEHGVKKGDRIAISLPNSPWLLTILYAGNKIGAVAVMMNPKSPASEIDRQLKMTECRMMFFSTVAYRQIEMTISDIRFIAVPVINGLPLVIKFALAKKMFPYRMNDKRIIKLSRFCKERTSETEPVVDDEADAVIVFSGGTSGINKAVVHSSRAFNLSAISCLDTEKPLPKELNMMAILPAFHIFGLTVAIHLPYLEGGYPVLVPFFNMSIITGIIRKGCPAFFPGVPTIFERLICNKKFNKLAESGKLDFSNFRHGFVGGDLLADDVRDRFNNIVSRNGGTGYISMGYGMSECCPVCVNDSQTGKGTSVGRTFMDTNIRIVNPDNNMELPDGETGNILIESTYLMKYAFDEDGAEYRVRKYPDGHYWHDTGDVGYVKDGLLYFTCRNRRIIKVSGNTVFASAVEDVIMQAEDVKCAYVVPVPHKTRGHGTFAFVEPVRDNIDKDRMKKEIIQLCHNRLVPYAVPIGIKFVDDKFVQKTVLGKTVWGNMEEEALRILKTGEY